MIAQVALDLPNIETLDYSYNPASKNNASKTAIIGHWVIVKVKNKKNVGLVVGVKNLHLPNRLNQLNLSSIPYLLLTKNFSNFWSLPQNTIIVR